MPRITGPGVVSVKVTAPVQPEPTEEEVPSSPGKISSASSESTKTKLSPKKTSRPPRARTAGSRSTKGQTES